MCINTNPASVSQVPFLTTKIYAPPAKSNGKFKLFNKTPFVLKYLNKNSKGILMQGGGFFKKQYIASPY